FDGPLTHVSVDCQLILLKITTLQCHLSTKTAGFTSTPWPQIKLSQQISMPFLESVDSVEHSGAYGEPYGAPKGL
ncbi:hypothetical protein FRC11_004743, partial [Ceratobasidium sp. 423]